MQQVVSAQSSLENRQDVEKELDAVKPDYVVNAAGLTGRPNVDWCDVSILILFFASLLYAT